MNTYGMRTADLRKKRAGFSLIEVVLALLIFAMGILAVLALFPTGSAQNRDAQDYTYSAQFARRVFAGVLAQAQGDTNFWERLSNHLAGGAATAMVVSPAPDSADFYWIDPSSFRIVCYTGEQTVVFRYSETGYTNITDHVLRYTLTGSMIEVPRNMNGIATWIVDVVPGDYSYTNADGVVIVESNTCLVTRWWIRESEWLSYDRRYRETTLRLVLTVRPGRYGSRNARTYYCYVPRFW